MKQQKDDDDGKSLQMCKGHKKYPLKTCYASAEKLGDSWDPMRIWASEGAARLLVFCRREYEYCYARSYPPLSRSRSLETRRLWKKKCKYFRVYSSLFFDSSALYTNPLVIRRLDLS